MDQASSPAANTTVEQAQKQGTVRGSKRLLELDGLRALAILPVLLYHSYPRNVPVLSALGEAGWMGVDLFFVLSGYLITGILVNTVHREHYYRNFIARRAIRIFPLYYVLLLVIILTAQWMYGAASWGRMQAWGVGWFWGVNDPLVCKVGFADMWPLAQLLPMRSSSQIPSWAEV